jgi:hypothetical protein
MRRGVKLRLKGGVEGREYDMLGSRFPRTLTMPGQGEWTVARRLDAGCGIRHRTNLQAPSWRPFPARSKPLALS